MKAHPQESPDIGNSPEEGVPQYVELLQEELERIAEDDPKKAVAMTLEAIADLTALWKRLRGAPGAAR
jgi:hypothetical protein